MIYLIRRDVRMPIKADVHIPELVWTWKAVKCINIKLQLERMEE
jgi:hypothetical protein